MTQQIALFRDRPAGSAALDVALSRSLLMEASRGDRGECLRIYQAKDALAFSSLDRNRPGFRKACRIAESLGYEPIVRLAGGQAAVFTEQSIAFAWIIPSKNPRTLLKERFITASVWIQRSLVSLGLDARVGAISGEYCPGAYSVNLRGKIKVMGVGQRIVQGAAHVGGVICVSRSLEMKKILTPIYDTLSYALEPETIGSLSDDLPGISLDRIADALILHFEDKDKLEEQKFQKPLLEEARSFESDHRASRFLGVPQARMVAGANKTALGKFGDDR